MASFNIITGRITNMSEKNTYVLLESAVSAKSAVSLLWAEHKSLVSFTTSRLKNIHIDSESHLRSGGNQSLFGVRLQKKPAHRFLVDRLNVEDQIVVAASQRSRELLRKAKRYSVTSARDMERIFSPHQRLR